MNGTRGNNGQTAFLESGEQQVVNALVVTHTIYHPYQTPPDLMVLVYKCKIASNGYAAGEEVVHTAGGRYDLTAGSILFVSAPGVAQALISSTNNIPGRGMTTTLNPTPANWKTQLRAFWFTRTNQL